MLDINQALKLSTRDEILQEVFERRDMIKYELVGRLYPSILQYEIYKLYEKLESLPSER